MLSSLNRGVKTQKYFVSSSNIFLDKKTLLKVWLNPGILIRGWFLCNTMQKQQKQNKTKQTNKSYLLIIAFVRLSQDKSGFYFSKTVAKS